MPLGASSPVEIAAGILRGRYTALVLWSLFWGGKSFFQLLRDMGGISRRALTDELTDLQKTGLVLARPRSSDRRQLVYVLSPWGRTLRPALAALYEWGLQVAAHSAQEQAAEKLPRLPRAH